MLGLLHRGKEVSAMQNMPMLTAHDMKELITAVWLIVIIVPVVVMALLGRHVIR